MDTKTVIELLIGFLIGSLLLASFVPMIVSEQTNIGPVVELEQDYNATAFNPEYNIWDGEDVVIGSDGSTLTVDGDAVTLSHTQRMIIASDVFACRTGGTSDNISLNYQYLGGNSGYGGAFNLTVSDGDYTLTYGSNQTKTGTLGWLVYVVPDEGNAQLVQPTSVNSFITSTSSDIIVLGSAYTSGDNDTFYSYYKGDLTVNPEFEDTSSIAINKTLKDGYTDIYDTNVVVTVGDETFTPWFILTPKMVEGHLASGPMYSIFGLLPLIAGVGLLMGAVVYFLRRY